MGELPAGKAHTPNVTVSFERLFDQFKVNMEALREFLAAISPHVDSPDDLEPVDYRSRLSELPEKDRAALEDLFEQASVSIERTGRAFSLNLLVPEGVEEPRHILEDQKAFQRYVVPFVVATAAAERRALRPAKQEILFRSVVTMAVSAFEVLLAGLVAENFKLYPSALGDDKEFSLADLRRFGTLDSATEFVIHRRVDSLMRGSLDEWANWIRKNWKIELAEVSLGWSETREIFERRHTIVHHAGRASRQYLERLAERAPEVDIGDLLPMDEDYVVRALDAVNVMGILLAAHAWSKLCPTDVAVASSTLAVSFDLMTVDRWDAAAHVALHGKTLPGDQYAQIAMQCNEWICRKRVRGLEDVRTELEEWDTSALSPIFALARASLLEDVETSLELIPQLIQSTDLQPESLRDWPLFEDLRRDERILKLIKDFFDDAPDDGAES